MVKVSERRLEDDPEELLPEARLKSLQRSGEELWLPLEIKGVILN